MAPIMAHGHVQIYKGKEISDSKGALIETVEGEKVVELLLNFNTGKVETFKLNDNIKSVALKSYGENQNHLYLTLQSNDLLFIEMLSSREAQELNMFLESVHQNKLKSPRRPDKGSIVIMSKTTQKEINKTSLYKVCKKSRNEFFEKDRESRTSAFQKMPSKCSKLTYKEFLESQLGKRKRILSFSSEMNGDKKSQKEYLVNKLKTNPLKYISNNWEKQSKLRELKRQIELPFESSFLTNFIESKYKDSACSQTLTEKIHFPLISEPNYTVNSLELDEAEMFFIFYINKQWQGLPNLGNTCYMNAVLQCLRSVPSFINDIRNEGFLLGTIPYDSFNMCLVRLLVLKYIYRTKKKTKLLMTLKKSISAVADIFSGDRQNDAHEFLGYCLDQLKDAMQKLNATLKTKNESIVENLFQQVLADNSVTKLFACPVITNFEFELLHSIFCKACGQSVIKTEPCNFVSVNLPQRRKAHLLSVQSTFDIFFEAEELEYKCEKCKHKKSFVVHKFSRLPRVLIVHLKRYKYSEIWSLRKDMQKVVISKYLMLSSHCNGNTKPPPPLSNNSQAKNFHFLNFFQKMHSKLPSSSTPAINMTSTSKDSLSLYIGSDKESKPQKLQSFLRAASRKYQQNYQGKGSRLNIIESESVYSGNEKLTKKELLADSVRNQIHKNGGKSTSHPETNRVEAHLQKVPGNPKLKMCEKISIIESTKDFSEDKTSSTPKRFQEVSKQNQQHNKMRIHMQAPEGAFPQSLPKPNAQGHTENLRTPIELNAQKSKVNSLSSLDPSRNPGNKDILEENTESKAKEPNTNADKRDVHTYQLIGVISHLGDSLDSGHYISDAYDFRRRCWFSYNDVNVSFIQETLMQDHRISTGYIFFYMHNEIFEELMVEGESFQSSSNKPDKTPQNK